MRTGVSAACSTRVWSMPLKSGLLGSMFFHLCYFRRVGLFRVAIKKTRVMLVYPRGFACFQLFCRFPRAVARCAFCALARSRRGVRKFPAYRAFALRTSRVLNALGGLRVVLCES